MNTTLYILHGWAYETGKWHPFLDGLNKHGIRGKMLEIPGLTAPASKPWQIPDYITWLHGQLPDTGKYILVGHSNGGRLALWYATAHPERIARIILIDSAGIPERRLFRRLKRWTFRNLAKTGKRISDTPRLRNALYRLAGTRDYNAATPAMKQTMINLITADAALPLESITVPVNIIWGENDTITPLSDGRELARRIPGAHLTVIPGARHAPQFTHHGRAVREILAVLNI